MKFNIVCNPSLSLRNKSHLEHALKPNNRKQFFDDTKNVIRTRDKETIPNISIRLTYLGRNNLDEVDDAKNDHNQQHGSILTFRLSHGIGDGASGYGYMKYLSDLMSKYDINEIDNNIHQITMQELNNELPTFLTQI